MITRALTNRVIPYQSRITCYKNQVNRATNMLSMLLKALEHVYFSSVGKFASGHGRNFTLYANASWCEYLQTQFNIHSINQCLIVHLDSTTGYNNYGYIRMYNTMYIKIALILCLGLVSESDCSLCLESRKKR